MFNSKFMNRAFRLASALFIILFSTGWVLSNSNSDSKSGGERTTDEVYKNIKVLKGMPASQLIPTMHFFEASLGFDCSNCHVRGHNDSDEKPEKRKARKMIEMVEEINKNNFDGKEEVTCFTCHQGNPNPQVIPAVATASEIKERREEDKKDEEIIKVTNRLDTPEEIIGKYQQSIGGKEAFEKISSLKFQGTITNSDGRNFDLTILQKAPDYYYSMTKLPFGVFERGFNGDSGWFRNPRGIQKLKDEDLQDIKLTADFYAPLNFLKNYFKLKFSDVQVIDGDTVYVVEGQSSDIRRFKFYFDTKSGLLVRQIQYNKTLLGYLQTQTDFKDYRNVNGVMFPFELHVADYERSQDVKFTSINANVTVDNNLFDPPK